MSDTLVYFNGRGAGEVIRLIYAAAGIKFTDKRVEQTEWPKIKQDMPMKALPVLEIKDKKHCQSGAIARFLAKKHGLFGSSDEESFDIDEVYECVQDAIRDMYKFVFEQDETKKAEAMKKFTDETIPKLNDYFLYKCKANKNKKGFIVGDKLSLADIIVFAFVDNITLSGHGELWKKFPEIEKHQKLIASQENIKAWVAKRPTTQF